MANEARIEQFKKMTESDPRDELAWMSLGNAYTEAGRHQEAAQTFQRVLALNSQLSKGYESLGRAQIACGDKELAKQTLRNGYLIAHKKGDLMPKNAMEAMLKEIGADVPAPAMQPVGGSVGAAVAGDGSFSCRRCGGHGPKLPHRPFKGALGEKVLASVCQSCWKEWVGMGTKVINELRLPMFDPQAQETYDKHMKEFLSLDDA